MQDPIIVSLHGLASLLAIEDSELKLLFGILGVILLAFGYFRASSNGSILAIIGWPMIGLHFYMDVPYYVEIQDPVLILMTAAGLPLTIAVSAWDGRNISQGIEDEALIWARGAIALSTGPYLIMAHVPIFNVIAVWITAWSANTFLAFSGHDGYVIGAMLVDTGTTDVLWSEWQGNRWILTTQLGDAGFHAPLLDQTSGQPTVSFVMACSAAQSMAVFIGALFAIRTAPWQRRMRALLVTVPTIFVLNTFRNAGIVWLHVTYPQWELLGVTMFDFAHSYAAKAGSLFAMFLMALVLFDLLPEMHRHIMRLMKPISDLRSST